MLQHGEIKTDVYMEEACCIPKGWGKEIIIENNELYCGKILVFNKGCKFSMHYHMNKDETWWVEEGEFNYTFIDTETAYPTTIKLSPGWVVRQYPGQPHQLEAVTDGRIFEVSTHHEDSDSYRVLPGDSQVEVWDSIEKFERDNGLGDKK
jgi:mannose-6-phosphate isomerase-like protein (cupin superfamily)